MQRMVKSQKKLNTVVKSSDKTEIIATSVNNSDFAGGFGTEKAPYLIATAEQFAKVSNHAEVGTYFRQIADININRFIGKFAGTYDGGNYKIEYNYTGSATYSYIFSGIKGYSEFKNICVVMGGKGVSLLLQADFGTAYGATFDNITFDSTVGFVQVNTNNFGFVFIEALYTPENASTAYYSFKNITNNVNLQNDGTCTGFIIGSGPCLNSKAVLNYDNCINNGTIIGTSSVGFLYGNTAYIESVASTESEFIINNCKNNAALLAIGSNRPKVAFALGLSELNEKYQNIVGGTYLNENYLSDKTFTVNQDGVEFSINTQDTAVSYKLAFKVAAIYMKKDGTAWTKDDAVKAEDKNEWDKIWDVSNGKRFLIDLPVNTDKTEKLSTEFKAYDKRSALAQGIQVTNYQNGYALVEKDNITYLVFDVAENVFINCTVQPIVYAYDASGTLKGIANAK